MQKIFGIKILTTKHEIMLHAVSLNLPTLVTAFYCVMSASTWDEMDQCGIDTAVRQWRTRLRMY